MTNKIGLRPGKNKKDYNLAKIKKDCDLAKIKRIATWQQIQIANKKRIATIQGNSPSQARLSDDPVDTILVFPLLAVKMEIDFFLRFDDQPAGPVRLGDESGDTAIPVVQRT